MQSCLLFAFFSKSFEADRNNCLKRDIILTFSEGKSKQDWILKVRLDLNWLNEYGGGGDRREPSGLEHQITDCLKVPVVQCSELCNSFAGLKVVLSRTKSLNCHESKGIRKPVPFWVLVAKSHISTILLQCFLKGLKNVGFRINSRDSKR